ncbi:hypothetical protein [Phormidium sp. CCY1219]|uniref:hypothetical protein n=1 Tax=Phormidium sp. CCY1219 TaxID=2886104 RepID=UPI002D1E4F9A|nr:hypothetical protein [Phormidium sp. CCY1219]MEB3829245.1 hypothetical protein [Phormidium sp. CCY1219]
MIILILRKALSLEVAIAVVLLSATMFLSGCDRPAVTLQSDSLAKVEKATKDYLESPGFLKEVMGEGVKPHQTFCAYQVYGIETRQGKFYHYLWTLCQEYNLTDTQLKSNSEVSFPIALILEKRGLLYKVIRHQMPRGGEHYSEDLTTIFPDYILQAVRLQSNDTTTVERLLTRLEKENTQAANSYFKIESP